MGQVAHRLRSNSGNSCRTSSVFTAPTLHRFRRLMSQAEESDVKLLLFMAQKMSQKKKRVDGQIIQP
jgi:hypothetical protein